MAEICSILLPGQLVWHCSVLKTAGVAGTCANPRLHMFPRLIGNRFRSAAYYEALV